MRTDELRSVLHDHGEEVRDVGAPARTLAVHRRVRAVRRRRATVAGGGLAAAVAAVALGVVPGLLPVDAGPADAPRDLAGFDVPQEMVATGYTYDYVRGIEAPAADGPLRLRLRDSDEPRLVMWASSADADRPVRLLDVADGSTLVRASGGFSDYRFVEPGASDVLVLRQMRPEPGDRLALAVFELSDERPDGVTAHGMTFRSHQLDDRLVDGVFGDRGETEVGLDLEVPRRGELRLADVCVGSDVGLGSGYTATVLVDGTETWGSSCSTRSTYDVGTDGAVLTEQLAGLGIEPGDHVRVTLRLEDRDGRRVEDADVVLGLAGYRSVEEGTEAAGWTFPDRIEHDGHVWALSSVGESDPGLRTYTAAMEGGALTPVVVATGRSEIGDGGRVAFSADGQDHSVHINHIGTPSGSWGIETVLEPSARHTATLTVRRGVTDSTQLAIGFYEPVH